MMKIVRRGPGPTLWWMTICHLQLLLPILSSMDAPEWVLLIQLVVSHHVWETSLFQNRLYRQSVNGLLQLKLKVLCWGRKFPTAPRLCSPLHPVHQTLLCSHDLFLLLLGHRSLKITLLRKTVSNTFNFQMLFLMDAPVAGLYRIKHWVPKFSDLFTSLHRPIPTNPRSRLTKEAFPFPYVWEIAATLLAACDSRLPMTSCVPSRTVD